MLYNTYPYPAISVFTRNHKSLGFQVYVFHTSVGWISCDLEMKSFASLKPLAMENLVGKNQ